MACYKDFSELLIALNRRIANRLTDRLTKGIMRVHN